MWVLGTDPLALHLRLQWVILPCYSARQRGRHPLQYYLLSERGNCVAIESCYAGSSRYHYFGNVRMPQNVWQDAATVTGRAGLLVHLGTLVPSRCPICHEYTARRRCTELGALYSMHMASLHCSGVYETCNYRKLVLLVDVWMVAGCLPNERLDWT